MARIKFNFGTMLFASSLIQLHRYKRRIKKPAVSHINSKNNPLSPIINVVCKYLGQFLGTSFGVTTLPICYNIE